MNMNETSVASEVSFGGEGHSKQHNAIRFANGFVRR